jgi:Sec7-like guanine-nucleotide exchange factor
MRQIKRRLLEIEKGLTPKNAPLKARSSSILEKFKEIEISLIDPKRESHRDVLRHSGGLSDSLTDLISLVSIGDEAPTSQAIAVSQEVIDKVNGKITDLENILKKDLTNFRATLMKSDLTTLESNLLLV